MKKLVVLIAILCVAIAIPAMAVDLYVGCYSAPGGADPGSVMRFDGYTGANNPAPAQTGALFSTAGASRTLGVTVGPDGYIYGVNAWSGVHKYDPTTGADLGQIYNSYAYSGQVDFKDGFAYVTARYATFDATGESSTVMKFDAATGTLINDKWAYRDPSLNQMMGNYASEWMPDNTFISLDARGHFLWFDQDGTFLYKQQIYTPGTLDTVTDLKYKDGYIYVASLGTNQIRRFAYSGYTGADLEFDRTWRVDVSSVWGIGFGPDGNMYASSLADSSIKKIDMGTLAVTNFVAPAQADMSGPRYFDFTPVPEPGSMLALGTGLLGLASFAIRRRK